MTGIAGWAEGENRDDPAERTIDRMLNAGHRHNGSVRKHAAAGEGGAGAVGVQGWPAVSDTGHADGIIATVHGHARWTDTALATLARERGHAAALIQAWQTRRENLFDALSGPASIALVDTGRHEALIAVDRVGIHQMCYAPTASGGLVFAADARAVTVHPDVETSISRQAIFNYLYFYVSPAPRTIFDGVRKLLAGQYALLRNGAVREAFYWQPPYAEPADADPADLIEKVVAGLEAGVGRAVDNADDGTGDGNVGAFLSGGLDSTTVSGFLAQRRPGAKCFTIAFPEEKYNELPWAEAGAGHFGVEHITHVLTPDETADSLAGLVSAYDEPHGNSSSVPAYICASVARDHGVTTLLAGDGGDEIFAGNERYIEQRRYDAWYRLPGMLRNGLVLPALRLIAPAEGASAVARARSYAERAAMPLPERLQAYNLLETTSAADVFDGDFLQGLDRTEPSRLQRESFNRVPEASELKRMHQLDLQVTLADNDLRKVNRACELAGIQVAYPMLDEDLVSVAAGVPSDMLLRDGRLRGFFKDAMTGFLPDSILTKPKHGFGMPFAEWTREPGILADMALAALDAFDHRRILRRDLVSEIRDSQTSGAPSRFGAIVWDVMMLESWLARHESFASIR